jgi:hypothetical protein
VVEVEHRNVTKGPVLVPTTKCVLPGQAGIDWRRLAVNSGLRGQSNAMQCILGGGEGQ